MGKLFLLFSLFLCLLPACSFCTCVIPTPHMWCPTFDGKGMVFADNPDMSGCPGAYIFSHTSESVGLHQGEGVAGRKYVCNMIGSSPIYNGAETSQSTLGVVGLWNSTVAGFTTAHGFQVGDTVKVKYPFTDDFPAVGTIVNWTLGPQIDCAIIEFNDYVATTTNTLDAYPSADAIASKLQTVQQKSFQNGSTVVLSGAKTDYASGLLFEGCDIYITASDAVKNHNVYALLTSKKGDSGSLVYTEKANIVVGNLRGGIPGLPHSFGMAWDDIQNQCGFQLDKKPTQQGDGSVTQCGGIKVVKNAETGVVAGLGILSGCLGLVIIGLVIYICCRRPSGSSTYGHIQSSHIQSPGSA